MTPTTYAPARSRAPRGERDTLEALRAGDAAAFEGLVRDLHPRMLQLARALAPSRPVAEEIAREAWLGVIRDLLRRGLLGAWQVGLVPAGDRIDLCDPSPATPQATSG